MKKIFLFLITINLFFFSCQSTNQTEDIVETKEQPATEITTDATEEISKEVSKTEESSEKINPDEEKIEELYYAIDEKILEEELNDDLILLKSVPEQIFEERIEETENIALQQDDEKPNLIQPEPAFKNEPKLENKSKSESKNIEQKPIEKTETQKQPIIKNEKPEQTQIITPSFELQKEISDNIENIKLEENKTPSRSVELKNNQFLEINYPGIGWIYLGELERENLLLFNNRKILDGNTKFTLKSRKSGTAILHFYKNDSLTGKYIDDYIEVKIDNESATDTTPVVCQNYSTVVPPKPEKRITKNQTSDNLTETEDSNKTDKNDNNKNIPQITTNTKENVQTIITNSEQSNHQKQELPQTTTFTESQPNNLEQNNQTLDLDISAEQLLQNAKNSYDQKKYKDALIYIDKFLSTTTENFDEGFFIKAKILEANSEIRNIKESIKNYNLIINDYPQSSFWEDSEKRIMYLKRFYIDIR